MEYFDKYRENLNYYSSASATWKLGKKHIFLSESTRQQLEIIRNDRRMKAATSIQTTWRAYNVRTKWPMLKQKLIYAKSNRIYGQFKENLAPFNEPTYDGSIKQARPQPISCTPPPPPPTADSVEPFLDFNMLKEACDLLGIDLNNTPLVPPCRQYVIGGESKYFYPQIRTIKMDYQGEFVC